MSKAKFDLSACDREPIHIPGSTQPHGVLLVVDAETLDIVASAGAIEDRLGLDSDWLGMLVAELLGQTIHRELQDCRRGMVL